MAERRGEFIGMFTVSNRFEIHTLAPIVHLVERKEQQMEWVLNQIVLPGLAHLIVTSWWRVPQWDVADS